MKPTITAFERSPDGGKGLARDTRVRWALEEVGQAYEVRLVSPQAMKAPAHRALHPFGQIPTYQDGALTLFETGAIVFHIASTHAGLLPDDAGARARVIGWMFAALNTVEPPILDLTIARIVEDNQPWANVTIIGDKMINVAIDAKAHSVYFYKLRGGAENKAEIVGRVSLKKMVESFRMLHRYDPHVSPNICGLKKNWIDKLNEQAIKGSGRISRPNNPVITDSKLKDLYDNERKDK